jgi:hypothetical protein
VIPRLVFAFDRASDRDRRDGGLRMGRCAARDQAAEHHAEEYRWM